MSRQSAGSLVGGVVGAAIGSFFPGGTAIGFSIGAGIGGYVTAPDVETQGPRLSDNTSASSSYGAGIPRLYGCKTLPELRIWSSGLIEHANEEDVGKGGPSVTNTTYTYTASWACLLCEGEIAGIGRIWFDGNLVYDMRDTSGAATVYASGELADNLTLYSGSETQTVSPTIEAAEGVGNVSAYRGWAYIVFNNLDVTKYGHIPFVEVEVATSNTPGLVHHGIYAHGHVFNDGLDGLRADQGILRFNFPHREDDVDNDRLCSAQGRADWYQQVDEYTMPLFDDGLAQRQLLPYSATGYTDDYATGIKIPAYTWSEGYLMGWIGQLPVTLETPFSSFTDHPWGNYNYLSLGIGTDNPYYPQNIDVIGAVTSNDASMLMVWTNDLTNDYLDVYDSSMTLLHNETNPSVVIYNDPRSTPTAAIENGQFLWHMRGTVSYTIDYYQINTDYSLTLIESIAAGAMDGNELMGVCSNGMFFIIGREHTMAVGYQNEAGISTVPLEDVVDDICAAAGLSIADYDSSDLTGKLVSGYTRPRVMSGRQTIEPLQQAYFFDAAEIDGQIVFVSRGGASSATLDADDLGAFEVGGTPPERLNITRAPDNELPRRVTVSYIKPGNYEIGSQYDSRQVPVDSDTEISLELPLVLTDDQAAQIAEVMTFGAWLSRERISFSTIDTSLNPTDVITVTDDGEIYTMRLLSVNSVSVIGPLQCEAVMEDTSIYSTVSVGAPSTTSEQTLTIAGPTQLEIIDSSLLRSYDADDGVYLAASGYYSGWPGCVVMRSQDNANWSQWISISTAATMGRADTLLGSASSHVYDTTNSLTVTLASGSLASVSETAFLNGANAALVGDEVVLFQTATQVTGDTWTISTLIRGARGTEWAIADHAIGDRFVLLDPSSLVRATLSTDVIGLTQYLRAVTIGLSLETGQSSQFDYAANGYQCYAPAHLTASDNGDGTYTATWVRRARKNAEWRDYVGVALVEDTELYRVEVWRAGSMLSTADVTSATATVTATTADIIRVAQVSATVGAGNQSEVTL